MDKYLGARGFHFRPPRSKYKFYIISLMALTWFPRPTGEPKWKFSVLSLFFLLSSRQQCDHALIIFMFGCLLFWAFPFVLTLLLKELSVNVKATRWESSKLDDGRTRSEMFADELCNFQGACSAVKFLLYLFLHAEAMRVILMSQLYVRLYCHWGWFGKIVY